MRVFFDTSVIVSAYTARGLSADLFRLVAAEHELLLGEVNLRELRRVLTVRFRIPRGELDVLEQRLWPLTVVPKPSAPSELAIRDPADRWVLASAVSAASDLLVTGGRDLLIVAARASLPILSPRAAWELLRGRRLRRPASGYRTVVRKRGGRPSTSCWTPRRSWRCFRTSRLQPAFSGRRVARRCRPRRPCPWEVGDAPGALVRRRVAEACGLCAYDAYALEVARAARAPLLSLDRRWILAARSTGVELLEVARRSRKARRRGARPRR